MSIRQSPGCPSTSTLPFEEHGHGEQAEREHDQHRVDRLARDSESTFHGLLSLLS